VVKIAEAAKGDDGAHLRRLDGSDVGSVLREREKRPVRVVPSQELAKQPSCVSFTDHDDMVEEVAAKDPDNSLDIAVHLRRSDGGLDGPNAETPDATGDLPSGARRDEKPGDARR
jgi:hypothetical protein